MKRTKNLALTSLMAVGGVSLTACGGGDHVSIDHGKQVDAFAYSSLAECKAKDEVPDSACDKAEVAANDDDKKAAKFDQQASCEDVYGEGQCVPRQAANGGHSIWGPLIAGFVVGRMLDGGWGGRGYYRDWRDGGYYTASGGRMYTDYTTGRTRMSSRGFDTPDAISGPSKSISRSGAISRGGFGGRMSSRGFGGGHSFGG